jgi:gamma-glutamyltranspeptidase/glutathione hydrolase
MRFTTRPEIQGTFGVVATTHWIATAVGMGVLERGGTAADAAVSAGLVLQVVEPHLNGPAGDVPVLVRPGGGEVEVICGQGPAPAGATLEHYRAEGLDLIPGDGLLAAVVPGAFDAWMLLLLRHGTLTVREALEPAIAYARGGHPVLPRVADTVAGKLGFFREHWPSSAEAYAPHGAPEPGALYRLPALAETYERIAREAEAAGGREAGIEAARRAWAEGFVAEAVDRFVAEAEVMDGSGTRHRGVLTAQDMAGWRATVEAPVAGRHHDWTVLKTGPWGQGPVLLQSLALLEGFDLAAMDADGPDFVHTVVEAMKLAYADREAHYGDPTHTEIPLGALLSDAHTAERRALIGAEASREQRPSRLPGYEAWADAAVARAERAPREAGYEPTMAHLAEARGRGDTTHLDVIDRWGNAISATPSGGWLQSSPVVPGLGFPLGTRAQMFWLEEGGPNALGPGRRPRTTLTPSIAVRDDGASMAFGTPGGDQQDQWQLVLFLRHVHHGLNLQEAIDAPLFHSAHFQGSFHPRPVRPAHVTVEPTIGEAAVAELRARGHEVEVAAPWSVGRLTATRREPDGLLRAAATPRLMQAYAAGR